MSPLLRSKRTPLKLAANLIASDANEANHILMITKTTKINVLQLIKQGDTIPNSEEYDFVLLDLMADGMISIVNEPFSIHITHFGFKELSEYDPILQVNVDSHLLEPPYGNA